MIRDAFHRQGPFVGSGGRYSPGPATDTPPFGRWADRSMTLSRHRGSSSGPSPFSRETGRKLRRSFRSPHPTMVSPTAVHFELGPRSLDPAAVFAARMPSLFETRCRLTTSATAYELRATKPYDSRFLAGTMASTTFLFLRTTPLIAEQWRAASRATSASACPGAGSSRLPRFAQPRCLQERLTIARVLRRSMHSED